MPRNPFSLKEQRRKGEQQLQPQQNRHQAAPPAANSYSGSNHPQTTDDARRNPRLGTAPSSFESSKSPDLLSKTSQIVSQNRTQNSPEHRIESAAPVTEERGIYEFSGNRLCDEEQRGVSYNHITNITSVGQHQKPSNHMGSRDQGRQVLAKHYLNSETRSANSKRLDSKVINALKSIENSFSHGSHHRQANLGDNSKVLKVNSPQPEVVAALPSSQNSKDPNTGDERFQGDDYGLGSAQRDPSKRNEVSYDGSLHAGGTTRGPVNGEYQQQWSGKPAQLSTNRVDQAQQNEEMQKLQTDHAIEMKTSREKHQAEVAIPQGNNQKPIENARLDRTGLMIAPQNDMQVLCDEDTGLRLENDDLEQVIVELRSNLESAQQALEKSKSDIINTSEKLQSTREEADRLKRSRAACIQEMNEFKQNLIEKGEQLAMVERNLANEQSQHSETVAILHQKIRDIEDGKEQVDSLITMQRQKIDQLKDTHTAKISRLAQEHNNEIGLYQERVDSLNTSQRQKIDQLKNTLTVEISRLAQEHNDEIGLYQERVDSLNTSQRQEIDQLKDTHKAEISRLAQEHNDEIDFYQQTIESVKTEAETERQKLQSTYEQQMAQFMDEHEGTVAQMKAELAQVTEDEGRKRQNMTAFHDQQKAQLIQVHKQTLSRKNEELAQVIQGEKLKISRLEEAHAAEQAQKDLNYAQGTRQLREDVKRLNAALLTRDDQLYQGELFTTSNLPNRPDEQIRGKFSEIEQMVDSLGRLQWKPEPAVWTSEVLRSIGGNRTDRVLKKAIVQDLVWCLLFNHIFCSPFRVFGAEGRLLEEAWNEQCGQGIHHHHILFPAA